jgi:hypothetical protein
MILLSFGEASTGAEELERSGEEETEEYTWKGGKSGRGGAGEEGVGCGGGGFFVGLEYGDGLDNTGTP